MRAGVLDAGVAIGRVQGVHRSLSRITALFDAARAGDLVLVISVVNLVEVLRHTADLADTAGVDPIAVLRAQGVRVHQPDEATARRASRLSLSLADAFAAATALALGARLHTTDRELVRRLGTTRVPLTVY